MHGVQEIEKAVSNLSQSELVDFRQWFDKYEQKMWDNQFKKDVKSGKLDMLADQAIADFKAGECKEI